MITITLLIVVSFIAPSLSLYFRGGSNSYAALERWYICDTSSLSFEFRTDRSTGLLLYQDDGGYSDYLELSLSDSSLLLKLSFVSGRVLSYELGSNLNDLKWHKVSIQREGQTTSLILDSVYQKWTANFDDLKFGRSNTKTSEMYMGGLPADKYGISVELLANPFSYLLTRYSGEIRDMSFINCTENVEPDILKFEGVVSTPDRRCDMECENDGLCYIRESIRTCDCIENGYTGDLCEMATEKKTATFSGSEFISYSFKDKDIKMEYISEEIRFEFKTESGDGMILYTGDERRYINIGLVNGQLYISSQLDNKRPYHTRTVGGTNTFDDNRWHSVLIKRQVKKLNNDESSCAVLVYVDDKEHSATWSTNGNFSDITSRELFVGGASDVRLLNGSKATQNFIGCLREVELKIDTIRLVILDESSPLFSSTGDIQYGECVRVELSQPVTIIRPDDYIRLPRIDNTANSFLSISFRTTERAGLLLYSNGPGDDVFAVELLDGYLYLILQQSSAAKRRKLSDKRLSDGVMHTLTLQFRPWGAAIMMNGMPKTMTVSGGEVRALNLSGEMYLGGLDYTNNKLKLNPHVYTASLHQGYVGCVHNVKINGKLQDPAELARTQRVTVGSECRDMRPRCAEEENYCNNSGVCREGWNRGVCDCVSTSQTGDTCQTDVLPARFNGSQYLRLTNLTPNQSLTEQFVIKFKTRLSTGVILTTQTSISDDVVSVFMYQSKLIVRYLLSGYQQVVNVGEKLNDGSWHILKIRRQNMQMIVSRDNLQDFVSTFDETSRDRALILNIDIIQLGLNIGYISSDSPVSIDETNTIPGFIGHIQYFSFNGVVLLAETDSQEPIKNRIYTCDFTSEPVNPMNIISTKKRPSIYIQTQPSIRSPIRSLSFWFKYNSGDGLLVYAPFSNESFFGLELFNGTLLMHYGSQRNTVRSQYKSRRLSNSTWHYVSMVVLSDGKIHIMVDDTQTTPLYGVGSAGGFPFDEIYVTGLTASSLYADIRSMYSPNGFSGCLGTFEINGARPDLSLYQTKGVRTGCPEVSRCYTDSCSNNGECITTETYERRCVCDMTSYSGPTCSQAGTTYIFGEMTANTDLLVYDYSEPYDTYNDSLAFGITTRKSSATLLRILSDNSNDYINITIKDGWIYSETDIGVGAWSGAKTRYLVNDGKYHIIRYKRAGSTSSLQVDDGKWSESPNRDEKLKVFNGITRVQIGGLVGGDNSISNGYKGIITGLVINGEPLLDDPQKLKVIGNVRNSDTARAPNTEPIQTPSPEAAVAGGEADSGEIIITGGSGDDILCNTGDDNSGEDCIINKGEIITITTSKHVTSLPPTIIPIRTTTKDNNPTILPIHNTSEISGVGIQNLTKKAVPPLPIAECCSTTSAPFMIIDHLPLIGGISGGALITLILIAVIACRLTRNSDKDKYKQANVQDPDPDLTVSAPNHSDDMNGSINNGNGHSRPNTKEWYV